jgi:hypothetical protein
MTRSGTAVLLAAGLMTAISLPLSAQQPRGGAGAPPANGGAAAQVPNATVQKTGAALGQIAAIRQDYSQRIQAAPTQEEKQGLADQARQAAVQAINGQGLSIDEYNRVIQLAQADQGLRQRLMAAAQGAR